MSKNTKSKAEPETKVNKLSRKERKKLEHIQYIKERQEQAEWEKEDEDNFGFESQKVAPIASKPAENEGDKKKKNKKRKKNGEKDATIHEVNLNPLIILLFAKLYSMNLIFSRFLNISIGKEEN